MTRLIKNLLRGAGSIMAIYPAESAAARARAIHPYRTDAEALRRDWNRVGQDLWGAMDTYKHEQKKQ